MSLLTGAEHWKPWEKSLWCMSLIFAAIWVVYVIVADIMLFQPTNYGREQTYTPRTYGSGDESSQISDFGKIMAGDRSHDLFNEVTQPQAEARSTRNMMRGHAEQGANEGYLMRGLTKAIGPVLGWFGFLFGLFSFIEKFENETP